MQRNAKQAEKIRAKIKALQAARDAAQDAIDSIEDNKQWEAADQAITAEYQPQIDSLYQMLNALRYPVCRGGWFADVFCASFPAGQSRISAKQHDIFYQHCEPANYKDNPHCVAGGRLISLCEKFVIITDLPKI